MTLASLGDSDGRRGAQIWPEWLDKRLVLFDIDGTLLRCGRQVGPIFFESMEAVFGTRGAWQGYQFSGKTDPQIVTELLGPVGHEVEDVVPRLGDMQSVYLPRLEQELDPGQMLLLPGVVELLEHLEDCDDTHLGLLTGNWERGARAKLSHFDLNRYFEFGAFGDDGICRTELPPAALRKAENQLGRSFAPEEVLIVGDTENDVRCAKAHGIQCLGVATGFVSTEALHAAGADWVVGALDQLDELAG